MIHFQNLKDNLNEYYALIDSQKELLYLVEVLIFYYDRFLINDRIRLICYLLLAYTGFMNHFHYFQDLF